MNISKALGLSLLVGVIGTSAYADSNRFIEVDAIQGIIAKKHAKWRAKENWITRLPREELQRMMGLQQPPQGSLDFEGVRPLRILENKVVDWRNKDGVNWLGSVMNQGNCGSCVAFSTVATLEAQVAISSGLPWLHPSYSAQALFACGGGGCDTGWMPDSAANYLQSNGIPDEACMPYTSGSTGVDAACEQKCQDSDSRSLKIAGFSTPSSQFGGGSVEAVKAALEKGPLVTTLRVYMDFVTYAGGIYHNVTGEPVGGHAVSLVGFDDSKRAWLIRNSWGTEWGENGFGWISWDDTSGVGAETWGFETPTASGYVAVNSPSERDYISGVYPFSAKVTSSSNQNLIFHIQDESGADQLKVSCSTTSTEECVAQVDTHQLKEGHYQVYVENANAPSSKSQYREFFVLNSEPKLRLSFAPANGVNLSAPLKDRPEFLVKASVAPVPIQHVEFRAIDKDGKIAARKSNNNVLAQMKMGWRTITVPDGQYQILFHGETNYNGKVYSVDSPSVKVTVKN